MELNLLSPTAHSHPLKTLPEAFILAGLLAAADPRFADAREIEDIVCPTVMAGGWTITARGGASYPDTFGLDTYCNPRRRCVDCSFGCSTERHLLDLSRRTGGGPVVWLDVGRGVDRLPWMLVQVWMPASPSLSGNWTPVWSHRKMRLELVSADAMTTAIIEPGGSLAIKHLMTPPRELRQGIARMVDRWTLLVEREERLATLVSPVPTPPLGQPRAAEAT